MAVPGCAGALSVSGACRTASSTPHTSQNTCRLFPSIHPAPVPAPAHLVRHHVQVLKPEHAAGQHVVTLPPRGRGGRRR